MKLKHMVFQYADYLTHWVNYGHIHDKVNYKKPNIEIVAICDAGKYSEGFVLFYREKEEHIPKSQDSLL